MVLTSFILNGVSCSFTRKININVIIPEKSSMNDSFNSLSNPHVNKNNSISYFFCLIFLLNSLTKLEVYHFSNLMITLHCEKSLSVLFIWLLETFVPLSYNVFNSRWRFRGWAQKAGNVDNFTQLLNTPVIKLLYSFKLSRSRQFSF